MKLIHSESGEPFAGPDGVMAGYVVGWCGHRVAAQEWRAGFRVCERDDPKEYEPADGRLVLLADGNVPEAVYVRDDDTATIAGWPTAAGERWYKIGDVEDDTPVSWTWLARAAIADGNTLTELQRVPA